MEIIVILKNGKKIDLSNEHIHNLEDVGGYAVESLIKKEISTAEISEIITKE